MGDAVSSSVDAALKLIRETSLLLKEENFILASPEDAQYFRDQFKKNPTPVSLKSEPNNFRLQNLSPPPSQTKKTTVPVERLAPKPMIDQPLLKKVTPSWRQEMDLSLEEKFDASPFKKLFAKVAPEIPVLDKIPSDAMAKKIANRWKTRNQTAPISILHYSEPPEQKALLEEIATALDVYFGPARLISAEAIEKEKQWKDFLSVPELRLVIVCDYTLWQLSDLMHHYKEIPAQGIRTLGKIPLFLFPDLSLYLKDPLLKRSLWKALCRTHSQVIETPS